VDKFLQSAVRSGGRREPVGLSSLGSAMRVYPPHSSQDTPERTVGLLRVLFLPVFEEAILALDGSVPQPPSTQRYRCCTAFRPLLSGAAARAWIDDTPSSPRDGLTVFISNTAKLSPAEGSILRTERQRPVGPGPVEGDGVRTFEGALPRV